MNDQLHKARIAFWVWLFYFALLAPPVTPIGVLVLIEKLRASLAKGIDG